MARAYAYRVVVVGIDFSAPSREALARAADLAGRLGARLHMVHVVRKLRPAVPFSRRNRDVVAALQREELVQARAKLEAWRPARGKLDVKTRVVVGVPSDGLLAHTERVRADLLVLSNLGHSSFQEILIGSTAARCLSRATVPVLLVPALAPHESRRRG